VVQDLQNFESSARDGRTRSKGPGFADRVLGLRAGRPVTDSAIENFETLRDHEMIYAPSEYERS
jgi:hypothetical protein